MKNGSLLARVIAVTGVLSAFATARAVTIALTEDPECCSCSKARLEVPYGGGNPTSTCAQQSNNCANQCEVLEQSNPGQPTRYSCVCPEGPGGALKIRCCGLQWVKPGGSWELSCSHETEDCPQADCDDGDCPEDEEYKCLLFSAYGEWGGQYRCECICEPSA